jgi:hypothetical protein
MGMSTKGLAALHARGFDNSKALMRGYKVACSQCAALVINGIACHESRCPNEAHECNGCNALIPARQKYCEDCQS